MNIKGGFLSAVLRGIAKHLFLISLAIIAGVVIGIFIIVF